VVRPTYNTVGRLSRRLWPCFLWLPSLRGRIRRTFVKPFILFMALLAVAMLEPLFAAAFKDSEVAGWVVAQEGTVVTDDKSGTTAVNLRSTWITDVDLDRLARLQDLRILDLSLTNLTDAGMERLKSLPLVTDLNLVYAELITDAGVAYLKGWKNLERLNLRGTKVNDTGLEHLKRLTSLKSLDLSFTEVTDNGLEHLASLTELQQLSIGGNKMSGVGLHSLELLPRLRSLDLSGSQRTDSGIWSISVTDLNLDSIAALAQLRELNLGGAKITNLGLKKLTRLIELRSLDLSGTQVSDKGLEVLSSLHNLEKLRLWKCKEIGDGAVPYLLAARRLVSLDLAETILTDKGLEQLQEMTLLRHLYLGGTSVTEAGIKAFKAKNPQCQISWGKQTYYENTKRPASIEDDP
jgi:Leucine-rich repeat (LRR) protein